jgi:hypothetical protein
MLDKILYIYSICMYSTKMQDRMYSYCIREREREIGKYMDRQKERAKTYRKQSMHVCILEKSKKVPEIIYVCMNISGKLPKKRFKFAPFSCQTLDKQRECACMCSLLMCVSTWTELEAGPLLILIIQINCQ